MTERVVYRCRTCGTYSGPHQIVPTDDGPPQVDCGCHKGPRWERGIWISVEVLTVPTDKASHDE